MHHSRTLPARLAALSSALALAACATADAVEGPPAKEHAFAATATGELIRFNAGQPSRVLSRVSVSGLDAGDRLVGIDFRVARGVTTRLHRLDLASGKATLVGRVGDGAALAGLAIEP